jgi:hypothetical protein
MTKKEAIEEIVNKHGLKKSQAALVWKQWKDNNKKMKKEDTLEQYLAPMLKMMEELVKLGEFDMEYEPKEEDKK